VAVEAAIQLHTSFEIDHVARLPGAYIRFREGLEDGGNAMAAVLDLFDREADAVVRKALVGFQVGGKGGRDPDGFAAAFGRNGFHAAGCFYNSGKHGCKNVDILIKIAIFALLKKSKEENTLC
jgi:hypothetical protein